MPVYKISLVRWEPQTAYIEIKADTPSDAIKIAKRDAKQMLGNTIFSQEGFEPDTTRFAKTTDIKIEVKG